jgi:hypothetical protein
MASVLGHSDAFYQAIQIAIEMTGQAGVTAMEREAATLQRRIDSLTNTVRANGIATNAEIEEIRKLAIELEHANEAVAAGERVLDGHAAKMRSAASATKGASFAMLEFSRGIEDLTTGGFLGILNNIPGMVQGITQSMNLSAAAVAKVTTGVSLFATALYLLSQQIDKGYFEHFIKSFDLMRDPLRDAASDVEGLKEKIKALGEQPFKVQGDYDALREMRAELKKTEEAIRHWEALRDKRTDDQEKAKKILEEGVVEGGGKEAVDKAIRESKAKEGTLHVASEIPGQIAVAEAARDWYTGMIDKFGIGAGSPFVLRRDALQGQVDKLKNDMEEEARQNVAKTIDQASRTPAGNKALQDLYARNQDIFEKNNVDPMRFGAALANSADPNADVRRKLAKDNATKAKAAEDKRQTDEAENIRHEADMKKETARELDAAQDEEIDRNLATGAEMKRLRLERQEAAKGQTKAATARQKLVDEQARRFGPGMEASLEEAATRHASMGANAAQSANRLMPQVADRLAREGVPADQTRDVAAAILRKVMDKVGNALMKVADEGVGTAGAPGAILDKAAADRQAKAQAAQNRAEAPTRKAQAQANQMDRAYRAQLHTIAQQEAMMGIVGDATRELAMIEARQTMLQVNINQLAPKTRNLGRRRPPVGPYFFGGAGM